MSDKSMPNVNKSVGTNFLPKFFQSDANKKFLASTIDQLVQPGKVKKVTGYIGRRNAKGIAVDDVFVAGTTSTRESYQLEPGIIVTDQFNQTTFFKDYQDYINQISILGGNTNNHARLNTQEFYSWDPKIDWDKFINFREYYWLPNGPESIKIYGHQQSINSTFTINVETVLDNKEYVFSPDGLTRNPAIQLFRGQTYTFEVSSAGEPFSIKTERTSGTLNRYITEGAVSDFAVTAGTITFTVPLDAPDVLYYVSENDVDLGGALIISDITENTFFDVASEIVGKKSYTLSNGTELSNGMKLCFGGNVSPETYSTGFYYVSGVGTEIQLIPEAELQVPSSYANEIAMPYDYSSYEAYPFNNASSKISQKDYITIERSSADRNPWSRSNRWFHSEVILKSAEYNGASVVLDQERRANRPIIEFNAGLQLFNFGKAALTPVALVDTTLTDIFSNVEGSLSYIIDGVTLKEGQRVLFTEEQDALVKNNIYKVRIVTENYSGNSQIARQQLHLELDDTPVAGDTVLVLDGTTAQGKTFFFNGAKWKEAQHKATVNQAPLFDLVNSDGYSLSDVSVYPGSTFAGTQLFSYKESQNTADPQLGFGLTYKTINNVGDIVFDFNLASDTFSYRTDISVVTSKVEPYYLISHTGKYFNGWTTSLVNNYQAAIRIYNGSDSTTNFPLDIYDNKNDLVDLNIRVYVNGVRLSASDWSIVDGAIYKVVVLGTPVATSDVVTIRSFATQPINSNGYYEIPLNLQNNPLNGSIESFTLGEVVEHVSSIVDNIQDQFVGETFGSNNLRDIANISAYGTKFVQHSAPASMSMYHITNDANNLVKAVEYSQDNYGRFKRNFITLAESVSSGDDIVETVDLIIQAINKDIPSQSPYYFSDMIGFGPSIKNTFTVLDSRTKLYPLTEAFSLDNLSSKAVNVYHNSVQLLYGKDYTFNSQGFVQLDIDLTVGDTINVYEYESTNGCYIPPTPTKLGAWPKFTPKIYLDTTLVTPKIMIQGHDGSKILAYGDYRDDIILELEKRIYNNIKVSYESSVFNIFDVIPGYNRTTEYSIDEFNQILSSSFYKWTKLIDRDFSKPLSFNKANPFTYNYNGHAAPDGTGVPGYWRGIYRWLLDTDRPHTDPWEMLGFFEQPSWWEEVYGPAPYTRNNDILWADIATGTIREPGKPVEVKEEFARPYVLTRIPVDDNGNLLSPQESNLATGLISQSIGTGYVFGDVSPVENAWRRSSYYPFAVIKAALLMKPAYTIGMLFDRSRVVRNLTGQIVYADTNLRVSPQSLVIPSIRSSQDTVRSAGLVTYLVDYICDKNSTSYNTYKVDIASLDVKLSYRVSGFTSKDKFNLLLDSKSPSATGSVFVPQEDYSIFLNSSSPSKKLTYSGVVITKVADGFEIRGYSLTEPFFKYYDWTQSGPSINIGGISESYSPWTAGKLYVAGQNVVYQGGFYKASANNQSSTFDTEAWVKLVSLPVTGGRDAEFRRAWDRTEYKVLPYNTKLDTVQDVVDFLLGHGEYLKDQGFVFDDFNTSIASVSNWETSAKEFMFWTTQNWSSGSEKWAEWDQNIAVTFGSIVKYNGDYWRAIRNIPVSDEFEEQYYEKLDGLSTVGSSVIALSPSANRLMFNINLAVVDDIENPYHDYEIFKVDGTPISSRDLNSVRSDSVVTYTPRTDGIFCASFYLIQKEHVVVINNTTMFNDTIYNPVTGHRHDRLKIAGHVSINWDGSFNAPGFVFDQATIKEWKPWVDYFLGDIVLYKTKYYTSLEVQAGVELFDDSKWSRLEYVPQPQMLPNWTYKAGQFTDFYNLDSDNFDSTQQQLAQHLIGYQKRSYLSNIIQNDVSEYKFYQGMIVEKGTQNSLNKLFDVLSEANNSSLKFYEEWAIRTGRYGASNSFDTIELPLDETIFKSNPQGYELVLEEDTTSEDLIIRPVPTDLYVTPDNYDGTPFPTVLDADNFLRTPGHVKLSEVTLAIDTLSSVTSEPFTSLVDGDYVWAGFEGTSWNVYRYTNGNIFVTDITYDQNTFDVTITTETSYGISEGDIIGISATGLDGFYTVTSVSDTSITVNKEGLTIADPFVGADSVIIYTFNTARFATLLDAAVIQAVPGDKIWVDSYNGGWATYYYVDQSGWVLQDTEVQTIDLNKIKSVFMYNKVSNKLISYIDMIDATQGKIAGPAEEELTYKTFYDPATYSIGTSSVNVDDGLAWTTAPVGQLWWDLRTARFINNRSSSVVYRNANTNTLYPTASIDVYEWVETTLLPESWDALADTEAGLASGISGTSLYGNAVYSIKKDYDTVSETFKETYYYWVKNKQTVPNFVNRNLSASSVAGLIRNPRGQGYQHVYFTGENSFSLINVQPLLENKNVIFAVEFWLTDKTDQNIHTQWKIISEDVSSQLPYTIEKKWVDSLVGKDELDQDVPDLDLPVRLRYGVENRPRQGMFINKYEATKQLIEHTNLVLINNQIILEKDISDLLQYDPEPSINSGMYDLVVDTDAELRFINIVISQPSLTPTIVDGKIVGVIINTAGQGYVNAPYISVKGNGVGAKLRTIVDSQGRITGVDIINPGKGYTTDTTLTVRPVTTLVHSDTASNDSWALYGYSNGSWERTKLQTFDVRRFWTYSDWYATGYSERTLIDFSVNTLADLNTISPAVGDIVKVKTSSTGEWQLLEMYSTVSSVDWTQMYKVVGTQNGTLQFKKNLYSYRNSDIGYDGIFYDDGLYDNVPTIELRKILETLKHKILIDDLKEEYKKLFFVTLRYALSEQLYVDWAFKTSFVKAQHNAGGLRQTITYQNDNLSDFEKYVEEVKPYRTKVREYVSNYSTVDTNAMSFTDFDLQPVYDTDRVVTIKTKVVDGNIEADNPAIQNYPWKHWYDNVGFEVTDIVLIDGGTDYFEPPVVNIESTSGTGAVARAFVVNGKVTRISLLSSGSGYLSAPTITLSGSQKIGGAPAKAVAIIGNSLVRSNLIKMKFDRVSRTYSYIQLDKKQTHVGTGTKLKFALEWAPDVKTGKTSVKINGVLVPRDSYTVKTEKVSSLVKGVVTFTTPPPAGAPIEISYILDISLLSAADRVNYFYNPESGDYGNELSQVMTGVDYGSVIVTGLGFDSNSGWGTGGYYTDRWDSFDETFDDYIVVASEGLHTFKLPYTPETNEELNVYHAPKSVYSETSSGVETTFTIPVGVKTFDISVTTQASSTANYKNTTLINVNDSSNIKVGSVLTSTMNPSPFAENTVVIAIVSSNIVLVNRATIAVVPAGTTLLFTQQLEEETNYALKSTVYGNKYIEVLQPFSAGTVVEVHYATNPVRIDGPNNLMPTIIADGLTDIVTIPNTVTINAGDRIIIRKSTSDGSIKPNELDYDTALSGGDLTYQTAQGIAPDEIVVDGDGFVTPTSSPATEEVVPGQVVDAVAIKVYGSPYNKPAKIKIDAYIASGTDTIFEINNDINSQEAVIVKVDSNVVDTYHVNFEDRTVEFDVAPVANASITIYSFGAGGQDIIDLDYFTADGTTTEFISKAPWLSEFTSLVYEGDNVVTPEFFKTDNTYDNSNRIGIRFNTAPAAGTTINYVIVKGLERKFIVTSNETLNTDGVTTTFTLQTLVGHKLPLEPNVIVLANQEILRGPNTSYFTIDNNTLDYTIPAEQVLPYTADLTQIKVFVGTTQLAVTTDYNIDLGGVTIKLKRKAYNKYKGKVLAVSIYTDVAYSCSENTITFNTTFLATDTVQVISSYSHDVLDIRRSEVSVQSNVNISQGTTEYYQYQNATNGIINLSRYVVNEDTVWVVKNNMLVTSGVDYKLNDDRMSLTFANGLLDTDVVGVILFANSLTVQSRISFMQFKDMLNRVHYKRLSLNKQTELAQDLHFNDTEINVVNGDVLSVPNPGQNIPGVVYIAGERIEYFEKVGNVLSLLRRGTLGTGTPVVHAASNKVQDIGLSETMPYKEETIVTQYKVDGNTNIIEVPYVPTKSANWSASSLPTGYGQCDEIEVFVGGYNELNWAPNTEYAVGDVVRHGTYTYRIIERHVSGNYFNSDVTVYSNVNSGDSTPYTIKSATTVRTFFIGNIRLKKIPFSVYDANTGSDSPAGDISFDADFAVDGTSSEVRLTNKLNAGTQVTVIKRFSNSFPVTDHDLYYSTNVISRFLNNEQGSEPVIIIRNET